jgi:hypothetical protein
MQYNKGRAMPIATGKPARTEFDLMLRMLPRFAFRILAVLTPLSLAACADTVNSGQPLASNSELQRQYDKTMTKSEQAQAISDLEQEKRRQDQVIGQDNSASAAPPAQPAEKPN